MSGFAPRETGEVELRRFAKKLVHDVVKGLLLRMPFETGQNVVALMPVADKFHRRQRLFRMKTAQYVGRHQSHTKPVAHKR